LVDLRYDPIRVFISSKQSEFVEERRLLASVLKKMPLLAAIVAEEWPAQRTDIRDRFLNDVRRSAIYVGLFGRVYSAPTELEYRTALENDKREILVYIRRDVEPEEPLRPLVKEMKTRVISHFATAEELAVRFEEHVWAAVGRMLEAYMALSSPPPQPHSGSVSPMRRRWEKVRSGWADLLPGAASPEEAADAVAQLQAFMRTKA
jgi:Domain of unknown function (DUF4062)